MIKTIGFKVYRVQNQSKSRYCYFNDSILWRSPCTGGDILAIPAFDVIQRRIKRNLWDKGFDFSK